MGLEEKYWLKDAFKAAKESMDEIPVWAGGTGKKLEELKELEKKYKILEAENLGWQNFFKEVQDYALKCPKCAFALEDICPVCLGTTWIFNSGKFNTLKIIPATALEYIQEVENLICDRDDCDHCTPLRNAKEMLLRKIQEIK